MRGLCVTKGGAGLASVEIQGSSFSGLSALLPTLAVRLSPSLSVCFTRGRTDSLTLGSSLPLRQASQGL